MTDSNLKCSALHHRLVLNRQTSEKVGHLSQLLFDPPSQKIVGFYCGGGFLGGARQIFQWGQIDSIGDDSLLVSGPQWEVDLKGSSPIKAPIGHEIWTDGGNQMGKVTDIVLDPKTGSVMSYVFSSTGWHGILDGTYLLPPIAVSSIGSQRMIVLETMLSHVKQQSEGLGQKAGHVTEFLKADLEQTKEDISALKKNTQSVVEKVKDVLPHTSQDKK